MLRLYRSAAGVAEPHHFGRTPTAVASAWSAATRARASRPKDGVRPGSTSSARHWVSDHATANRPRQRSQRKVVDASTKGRRLLQRGQTAYLKSSGLRRTSDQNGGRDRKSTRLNSSHLVISYAVFCLKK